MSHRILTNQPRGHILSYVTARHPTMLETDVISPIRDIFLQPRPHVSISQATRLLGWTHRQMSAAIEAGGVELWTTPLGEWVPRAGMMAKALGIWALHVIEEGPGGGGVGSLPHAS